MAPKNKLNRRDALKAISMCAAGSAAGMSSMLTSCRTGDAVNARAPERARKAQQAGDPKFLIVLASTGGASIIDSFLAIRENESDNGASINAFPESEVVDVADSPFRAVNMSRNNIGQLPFPFQSDQASFVNKHKDDMMVATLTGTSVNHGVAQKRAVNGNGAWSGRTLQECVAQEYGAGFPLPNVNMAGGGYGERGVDRSLDEWAYGEPVANPALWFLGMDGAKGVEGAPDPALVELARRVRNEELDEPSAFWRTFINSKRLARWRQNRTSDQTALQGLDLISRLNIFPDNPPDIPLSEYGLSSSPEAALLRQTFPDFLFDPLEAQAAIAFLLIKYRISVTVTISPTFNAVLGGTPVTLKNPPLSFDFSHNAHRETQAFMWQRQLSVADRLIGLLQAEEYQDGESYWDRSLMYFGTDFGRSKVRPNNSTDFGSGHEINNGVLVMSPMANGNTLLGGVDKNSGMTHGFNPETGAPEVGRTMTEPEIFAGILQAMGVDTSPVGLPDMPAMRS